MRLDDVGVLEQHLFQDGGRRVAKRRCRPTDIGDDATLIVLRERLVETRLLTVLGDATEGVRRRGSVS